MSDLSRSYIRFVSAVVTALAALLSVHPAAAQEMRTTTTTQSTYETRTSTKRTSRATRVAGTIRPRRSHRSRALHAFPVRMRLPHTPSTSLSPPALTAFTNPYLLSAPETTETTTTNSFRTTYRRTTQVGTARQMIPTPRRAPTAALPTAAPNLEGQVWLNTQSGIYWRPGSRWFGKTRQGRFLTEAEAIQAGYRAASGQ